MRYRFLSLAVLLGGLGLPLFAGEVVVTLVDVYPPAGFLMNRVQERQRQTMIEQFGEEEGERMFALAGLRAPGVFR